jgi:hypothetical protein
VRAGPLCAVAVRPFDGVLNKPQIMTFLPNGKLKVEQKGEECGFGHNVYANGTFRKISSQKPKFDDA